MIDFDDFIGPVVDQVRPLAEAKSITLTESISTGLAINGNVDLLIRLILNLLDNALKYTPNKGTVTVTAVQERSTLN